ncbi:flagellar hook-basal body complex protein [Clostridium sp. DJ247]|uniref:flagellar hook-basal body complex protein n=1 Tax=Clostridium sp. DJ247 TaxID=2726188 RepID=UPI001628B5E6|nr:flagellar hook-basal body complex protein [Clostridium sp. DJ247]MBC2582134.1 flagellar hook-basal body complex protein [Clostridium sp. DJ247]
MLPSMFSGISGLKANQKKLDVIGNNIANSSTTAFKAQRIRFQDMVSQNLTQAIGASVNYGGTNPRQIGLGVQIAGIDTVTSTGNMQPTSRNLDAAIDGEGYFMVAKGPALFEDGSGIEVDPATHLMADDRKGESIMFSRDGAFTLDSDGNLLTSDGNRVLGYTFTGDGGESVSLDSDATGDGVVQKGKSFFVDSNQPLEKIDQLKTLIIPDQVDKGGQMRRIQSFSIEKDGLIKAVLDDGSVSVLGQIAMASFKNPGGLSKLGKNLYQNSANSGDPVIRASAAETDDANKNNKGYGDMLQGMLEMSNVDLAEQFTDMIIASRAFQANGKIITTGDEILQDLVNLKR